LTHGSTIVTLKPWFLNSLGIGEYMVTLAFKDGVSATGVLLVKDSHDRLGAPNTGIRGACNSLINKLLAPDTGKVVFGLVILGEVVFVVVGIAVFFKVREA